MYIQPSINCILLETATIGLFGFLLSCIIFVIFYDRHTNKRKQRIIVERYERNNFEYFAFMSAGFGRLEVSDCLRYETLAVASPSSQEYFYLCFCFPFTDKSGNSTLTHSIPLTTKKKYSHPPHFFLSQLHMTFGAGGGSEAGDL